MRPERERQLQMLGRNWMLSGVVQETLAALADQKAFFEEGSTQPTARPFLISKITGLIATLP